MNSALRTFVVGGVLGAGILSGGALAFAQTSGTTPGTVPPAAGSTPGTTPGAAPGAPAPDGTPAPPDCGEHGGGGPGAKGGRAERGPRGEALAAALGVTVEQLKEAEKAANDAVKALPKPEKPATRPPSDADKQKMQADRKARVELHDKVLAEKLGITTEKLRDARIAVESKRLDEAVAAGKLTREQADKRLQALRDGTDAPLGGPGGHGHGPGAGGRGRGPKGG
jgi:hypothetical protein